MDRIPTMAKQYRYTKDKPSLLARMKKIEGQAKGIQRMIEEDRYCIDIAQQLAAPRHDRARDAASSTCAAAPRYRASSTTTITSP